MTKNTKLHDDLGLFPARNNMHIKRIIVTNEYAAMTKNTELPNDLGPFFR